MHIRIYWYILLLVIVTNSNHCAQEQASYQHSNNSKHRAGSLCADAIAKLIATTIIILAEPQGVLDDINLALTGEHMSEPLQVCIRAFSLITALAIYQKTYLSLQQKFGHTANESMREAYSSLFLRTVLPYPLAHLIIHY